jgi:pantothenate kinase type III
MEAMAMPIMVIDAGNTLVKAVLWENPVQWPEFAGGGFLPGKSRDNPVEIGSIATSLHGNDPLEFSVRLDKWAKACTAPVVAVSVVPEMENALRVTWPALQMAGLHTAFPYPCEIEQAGRVGPDRFCNVAAALAAGLETALVVDAGTATTFDLLVDGVFKGGLISPGMAFAAEQLAKRSSLLEDVSFEARPLEVGRNTRDAMRGGAWSTGYGGVEWTISRLLEKYGPMPVILTGGLAGHLQNDSRYWDPHWTLRGASHLADRLA